MQSFSISGASEVLERDRRPIIRALRHAAPDEVVKKQQRSRMPTILAALEAREPKRNKQQHLAGNDSGRYGAFDNLDDDLANDRDTLRMFGPINAAIAKLEAQPSVAKRRDMAPALMLIVERSNKAYRSHRATTGEFIDSSARTDCMSDRLMTAIAAACKLDLSELILLGGDE